jgi:hypothetical protein
MSQRCTASSRGGVLVLLRKQGSFYNRIQQRRPIVATRIRCVNSLNRTASKAFVLMLCFIPILLEDKTCSYPYPLEATFVLVIIDGERG